MGLLVNILFYIPTMLKIPSSSFMNTQKDKRGYNSMYTTQFLAGEAEGRMVVSSLMRAGHWEEGMRKGGAR